MSELTIMLLEAGEAVETVVEVANSCGGGDEVPQDISLEVEAQT